MPSLKEVLETKLDPWANHFVTALAKALQVPGAALLTASGVGALSNDHDVFSGGDYALGAVLGLVFLLFGAYFEAWSAHDIGEQQPTP